MLLAPLPERNSFCDPNRWLRSLRLASPPANGFRASGSQRRYIAARSVEAIRLKLPFAELSPLWGQILRIIPLLFPSRDHRHPCGNAFCHRHA